MIQAGFLHEYKSSRSYPNKPDASIFVPHYNVSTLSTNLHHNLIFQLQAQERHHLQDYMPASSSSGASTASSSLSFTSVISEPRGSRHRSMNSKTLTFRAKSASDMQAWLEHLTELSYRYRPSVSYSAPPFSQPTNATNPEVLITSPTMTVVDKQQVTSHGDSTTTTTTTTESATSDEKESQQPHRSIIAPMIVPSSQDKDTTHSNASNDDVDDKAPSSLVDQQQHPSPIISSPLSGCLHESPSSSSTKEQKRPFMLMGVCLPEDMQS